ncbi:MAG: alcohol dehydrogenase catalytic domain-containing protein [Dysosmobacter sp.]
MHYWKSEAAALLHERDAIVKVTLASICSSDLHIKHGSVPRAVPGITVGHEMVGVVESVGSAVTHVKPWGPGDGECGRPSAVSAFSVRRAL